MSPRALRLARASGVSDAVNGRVWAGALAGSAYGVRFGVRVDDAALLPAIEAHLPPGSRPLGTPLCDHLYSLAAGDSDDDGVRTLVLINSVTGESVHAFNAAYAIALLESQIRVDLATAAAPWVFVHAGAVAWRGRGIVLPGSSGHGKSRLVEALVRAGATYYSDEFAVFDGKGLLHPYPKPIARREPDGSARPVTVAELGGDARRAPVPVGRIAAIRYERGAIWRSRAASPGEALMALLPHTACVRIAPRRVLRTFARAVERALFVEGPRGEADEVAPVLLNLVGNRPGLGMAVPARDAARRARHA